MTYSVHEAKTHFSKLLDLVEGGEDVIIIRHGQPFIGDPIPWWLRAASELTG